MSMHSSQHPLTNPFTGENVESLKVFDKLVAHAAELFIEDPSFLAGNDELRARQLGLINRGVGSTTSSQVIEMGPVSVERVENSPLKGVLDVSEKPFGAPDDKTLRLDLQGQGNFADTSRNPKDRFARDYSTWRPKTQAEMNTALHELNNKFNSTYGHSISGAEDVVSIARNWRDEAVQQGRDLNTINGGWDRITSATEAATVIRGEKGPAYEAVVAIRTAAYVFEHDRSVVKGKSTYRKFEEQARRDVDELSDKGMYHMWQSAGQAAKTRAEFWQGQLDEVEKSDLFKMLGAERNQASIS